MNKIERIKKFVIKQADIFNDLNVFIAAIKSKTPIKYFNSQEPTLKRILT